MKWSLKAALCSALIFPGAGHILLRQYFIGALLGLPAFGILLYLFEHYRRKANALVEVWLYQGLPSDLSAMTQAILAEPDNATAQLLTTLGFTFLAIWTTGILLSAFAGHRRDKQRERPSAS